MNPLEEDSYESVGTLRLEVDDGGSCRENFD